MGLDLPRSRSRASLQTPPSCKAGSRQSCLEGQSLRQACRALTRGPQGRMRRHGRSAPNLPFWALLPQPSRRLLLASYAAGPTAARRAVGKRPTKPKFLDLASAVRICQVKALTSEGA